MFIYKQEIFIINCIILLDAATGSKLDADTRSDNEGLPRTGIMFNYKYSNVHLQRNNIISN